MREGKKEKRREKERERNRDIREVKKEREDIGKSLGE